MLSRLKQVLGKNLKLLLYKTLIVPLFDYGDVIYDCLTQHDSLMLQRLQDSALRLILDADWDTRTALMHEELNVITLEKRRKHHTCHQTYKIYRDGTPDKLREIIKPLTRATSIHTRSADKILLEIPNYKLNVTRKSYNYRGPFLWNDLEEYIKRSGSLEVFKKSLYYSSKL